MAMTRFRKPPLATFIVAVLCFYFVTPSAAGTIQSRSSYSDIDTIQRALENKIVREKFAAYGMSTHEIAAKLTSMTDHDVHLLARASDEILAGGDSVAFGIAAAIGALIIAGLVMMILNLFEKEIIVR